MLLFSRCRRILGVCSLALGVLAGCQSASTPDVLASAEQETLSATSGAPTSVGTGSARIALLVDRGAGDYRDGAALAVKEIGGGALSLTVQEVAGDATAAAKKAAADGARFFIGSPWLAKAVAAGASGSAVVLLASEPESGGVAIVSDEIGGLVEVAAYAAGAGRTQSNRPIVTACPIAA